MCMEKLLLAQDASVLQAMQQLDETGCKILLWAPEGRLAGVLTDGDVRRYILRGGRLDAPALEMVNLRPHALRPAQKDDARRWFKRWDVSALPVVDKGGRVLDVVFASSVDAESRTEVHAPVVMMAGGLGTRLYPYTKILPKPLIPVGELPIAEHIINRFADAGCSQFTLIVNYKKSMIKAYFGELEKEYTVDFADEDTPLGTGGGLSLLRGKVKDTFFLTNCDILVDADFGKIYQFHKENRNRLTMVCALKNFTIPYGVVEQENGVLTGLKEKPHMSFYTNTGLYVVDPDVLDLIEPGTYTPFTDVVERVKAQGGRVGVYPVSEHSWMDMGQLEELDNMRRRLEEQSD